MSFFIPQTIVDQLLQKSIKLSSIQVYNYAIKRIFINVFHDDIYDKNKLINNSGEVMKYLSMQTITVEKSLLNSIRNMLSIEEFGPYNKRWTNIKREYREEKDYSIDEKKLDQYIPLEDLSTIVSNIKNKNTVKYFIGLIYITMPTIRGQDLYNLKISSIDIPENYLDVKTMKLYIKDHKTVKQQGIKIIAFPKVLHSIIKEHISGSYLLLNNRGGKYTKGTFAQIIKRMFGFGIDILRRIYITEMLHYLYSEEDKKKATEWRKKLAHIFGHSLSSQEFDYKLWNDEKLKYSSTKFMKNMYENLKQSYV